MKNTFLLAKASKCIRLFVCALINLIDVFFLNRVMDRTELYKQLFAVHLKANPSKQKVLIQGEVNGIWNSAKKQADSFESTINEAIEADKQKTMKQKANLMKFWVNASTNTSQKKDSSAAGASSSKPEETSNKHLSLTTEKFSTDSPGIYNLIYLIIYIYVYNI